MNAQNNETSSPDILPSPQNVGQVPSVSEKVHPGILDTIAHLFHKKSPAILLKQANGVGKTVPVEVTPIVNTPLSDSPTPAGVPQTVPDSTITEQHTQEVSEHKTLGISDRIAGLFHKDVSQEKSGIVPGQVSEMIKPEGVGQVSEQVLQQPTVQTLETPATDERFARLLAEDSIYQSMIRSQDIKNIRLQLSMRYMLLMLAIFLVIAWVVNNRVIMFGFYDYPILSRIRDALFGVLTGLFCLTVWFGSTAWFQYRIIVLVLRSLAVALFGIVIVGIYLPFWR